MLGNIIGDLAGSVYEFEQISSFHPVVMKNVIEDSAFFSDDTILTIAIADAIVSYCPYSKKLREYAKKYDKYLPTIQPYFSSTFSPGFTKWAKSNKIGTSNGNGAMMRVAPVGFLFNTEEDVLDNAKLATMASHNSDSAIKSAQTIALIIFYARNGLSKYEIMKKLNINVVRPSITKFNYTCEETLDICLFSFFMSNSFEDAIRLAISFGGDTDTNACIVGGMAEAMWGISRELKEKAIGFLPREFKEILDKAYSFNSENVNKLN